MRPPKYQFPKTDLASRGLLFAQTAQMLLNESAYESFRLQALDCLARLREIINTAHEIGNQNVSPRNIVDPCHEFATTFNADFTARRLLGDEANFYAEYFFSINDAQSKKHETIGQSASYVYSIIKIDYKSELEKDIIASFGSDEYFSDVYGYLSRYLSAVINSGYSKYFVKSCLEQTFFETPIKRFDKRRITKFFEFFRGQQHSYEVWLPVFGSTAAALKNLAIPKYDPLTMAQLPPHLKAKIQNAEHYPQTDFFLHRKDRGVDPYAVERDARTLPRILRSISLIQNRSMEEVIRQYCFVKARRSNDISVLKSPQNRLHKFGDYGDQKYVRDINKYTKIAISAFDASSTQRLLSSSENVIQASTSAAPENQLISIWSAIEVLFGDPPDDESRIMHYRNCLTPCICINYPWRYTNAVYSELSKYHLKLVQDAMDKALVDQNLEKRARFQNFMFSKNHSHARSVFLNDLSANPLAYQLVTNMLASFGSFESLHSTIKNHEKRVSWQISRIYRARNEFIHGGTSPDYIDALAKNSFEYFRTCMQSIIFRAEKSNSNGSIDMFVQSIQNSCLHSFKAILDKSKAEKKGAANEIIPYLSRS